MRGTKGVDYMKIKIHNSLFLTILTLLFITLKLLKVINWSWFWVLCPLWVNFLLVILVSIVVYYICYK